MLQAGETKQIQQLKTTLADREASVADLSAAPERARLDTAGKSAEVENLLQESHRMSCALIETQRHANELEEQRLPAEQTRIRHLMAQSASAAAASERLRLVGLHAISDDTHSLWAA